MEPDFSRTVEVDIILHHVRMSRLLVADETLESQGVQDGDVFVLFQGAGEALGGLVTMIRDTR